MKLISWNVNGLRAAIKNGFVPFVKSASPDILAIQETKISEDQVPPDLGDLGYSIYVNSAVKKGYSGTMVFSRVPVISTLRGIGDPAYDSEGRVLGLELEDFYFLNIYFPNSQHGLLRLDYKLSFNSAFHRFCNSLQEEKPVLITGDFNVAHKEIDIANPKGNERNAGFTIEERNWMSEFLNDGYVDTFRMFNSEAGQYSWWSYMYNARAKNIGWRIDYFIASESLKHSVKDSSILKDIMGSDHAPVQVILET